MGIVKQNLTPEQDHFEHLQLVQALSREITAAISAVERNDLRGLQATIANQEKICDELVSKKWLPPASGRKNRDAVQEAYVTLSQLNRVYAGVIKRSKRCADLLSALYGASQAGYGKNGTALENRQSWICEV